MAATARITGLPKLWVLIVQLLISNPTTVSGMPIRPTNITRAHTTYSNVASNVTLSWNLPTVGRVDMYHVNVSYEPNMLMNYSTNTPAVTVEGIPYDQQVIVSITSVNCYSDSERAYFNINISRCNKTAPKDGLLINDSLATVNSIPGEEIMFTCNPGYAPQVLNTAICKEDGMWDPDPTRTMCLIECQLPVLSHLETDNELINSTVVGGEIHFKCPSGFITKSLRPSVCSSDGVWVPDPQEYECQIEDIQQNSHMHNDQSVSTKIIAGSITGFFLVASAFLCVTLCTTFTNRETEY